MLNNVTGSETDTFDEVNKILNRIIDNFNSVATANNEHNVAVGKYNAEVDKYNRSVDNPKKGVN